MEGIKLRNGKLYVEHRGLTARVDDAGNCELCPMQLLDIEWYVQSLQPEDWWELNEAQIQALPGGVYDKIVALVKEVLET